jgi:hypothetical protein
MEWQVKDSEALLTAVVEVAEELVEVLVEEPVVAALA